MSDVPFYTHDELFFCNSNVEQHGQMMIYDSMDVLPFATYPYRNDELLAGKSWLPGATSRASNSSGEKHCVPAIIDIKTVLQPHTNLDELFKERNRRTVEIPRTFPSI